VTLSVDGGATQTRVSAARVQQPRLVPGEKPSGRSFYETAAVEKTTSSLLLHVSSALLAAYRGKSVKVGQRFWCTRCFYLRPVWESLPDAPCRCNLPVNKAQLQLLWAPPKDLFCLQALFLKCHLSHRGSKLDALESEKPRSERQATVPFCASHPNNGGTVHVNKTASAAKSAPKQERNGFFFYPLLAQQAARHCRNKPPELR